ncbi:MAG: 30S ribosome-binding factor RbfA [Thermodesulfovibrionales bacterium]
MLPYKRSQRVSHLLKKEISDIIMNRVKDPRLGFLTVTDVDLTADLKLARVYVSVLRDEEKDTTFEILESARAFIRAELGRRLRMKVIPALDFRLDTTAQYGARIEKLLKDIKERG